MWVCNFTSFVCWLQQIKILAAMLFCLQGLLARLSQHEFHLGRDWPLEIGGRFACCSWVTSQEKTVSPKCDPQHRPLKTQKNTQSENFFFQLPTDICKVFFGSSIFRVYFTLGNGADSQAPSCTKFGPRSWFFISGFCKDGKGTWPISPCHPSKYTQYSTKFSFQNISLRHVS